MASHIRVMSFAAALVLVGASQASANTIYAFSDTAGSLSVSGTITTDGDTGTLSLSDIVSWQFTITGAGCPCSASGTNVALTGSDLTASGTNLLFNFSDSAANQFVIGTHTEDVLWASAGENPPSGPGLVQINSPTQGGNAFFTGDLVIASVPAATPLPAALPLFASALGGLGLLGWRRKRKAALAA
jgi:hypothetical protein